MNATRITGLIALAASFALSACGGGGAPTVANVAPSQAATASAYTGPAPATADVQAFEVNLWNNIRVQNRCGQCHNATSPAQMPNFARSDDVNLAYVQANTVVNLAQPSMSTMVVKVSGGHNCWLADNNACGQILTTWITNWANATGATATTTVQLVAPPVQTVGQSLNFPASYTDYQNTVYTLTSKYCVRCHSTTADPSVEQAPYHADPNLNIAYPAAIPKIDFTGCSPFVAGNSDGTTTPLSCGVNSRLYQRLLTDNHNCWDNCASDAAQMLAQIQAFAQMLTPSNIDPSLVVSKAITLTQGTIASGASRYDADTIAKYEFQSVVNNTTFDTSGIDPAADLTISGNVTLAGGWGIIVGAGGKAQATTSSSSKLYNLIQATGQFSIEAWVAPALVAADKSYMVSYSGGDTTRNFTLGQTNQDYDFMLRTSTTALTGMPQLQTPNAAMALQASLQHVVLTYDSVNGRQIFVNGVNVGGADPQKGGTISNWDSTFALVLGNEVSGDRSWQGLIKFVAIHSRAMTAAQVMQNFNAGVGERYYMLFNVANVTNVSQSYIMFTVSQYDSYGYLFYQPTFISLDPTVTSANLPSIPVQGIRIGLNGAIPQVGQAYIPLNTTVTAANYTATGEVLSPIGTVIALQSGPATDQFFLTFDVLGSQTHVVVEPIPTAPAPSPGPVVADIGVRTFAQVNSTLSALTGVPTSNANVVGTYQAVQQQLPATPTLESFSAANQVGVAQLAIQYCNVAVNTPALQSQLFGFSLSPSQFTTQPGIDSVTSALAQRVLGSGLKSAPPASSITNELSTLIGQLCTTNSCTTSMGTNAVAAAACATAFGSANMLIN
ncbi:MAG TPA: LamG domain-containing protein [Steroidobacteraceae bacterium]|nr:LamG domain-containing protein [Steroidobacteraceae bacterium]